MRKLTNLIVVHCSATRPSHDVNAKEIDRWHRKRGWLKIGYHFVIKRDGTVETGRQLNEVGAHVAGFNSRSIGLCLIGGVTEEDGKTPEKNFTDIQWTALEVLLREMRGLFPEAKIVGHNELNSYKACPSFDVQEYLADPSRSDLQSKQAVSE